MRPAQPRGIGRRQKGRAEIGSNRDLIRAAEPDRRLLQLPVELGNAPNLAAVRGERDDHPVEPGRHVLGCKPGSSGAPCYDTTSPALMHF